MGLQYKTNFRSPTAKWNLCFNSKSWNTIFLVSHSISLNKNTIFYLIWIIKHIVLNWIFFSQKASVCIKETYCNIFCVFVFFGINGKNNLNNPNKELFSLEVKESLFISFKNWWLDETHFLLYASVISRMKEENPTSAFIIYYQRNEQLLDTKC